MSDERIVKGRWRQRRSLFVLLAALALLVAVWSWLAFAVPRQQTLDQHVKNVASQLRCPVCQGESVADSPALLAQQMRQVIREQLQAGRSDQDIVQYFASRYGEQNVVWSPPRQGFALLAWLVPIALVLGGVVVLFFVFRDWQASSALASVPRFVAVNDTLQRQDEYAEEGVPEDSALEEYRAQIEHELAADDPLFRRYETEAK
jgi:cytochrome c-type biogenesis protein CcmH